MAIYYLDVDDEITSAAARIRDSSDSRIALVLSGGSRVATSRINFRLLAREAKQRRKRLAIITGDTSVQSVARSAELPVYGSVGEYEKSEAAVAASPGGHAVSQVLDELALTVGPALAAGSAARLNQRQVGPGTATTNGARRRRRVPRPLLAGVALLVVCVVAAGGFFFYPSATVVLTLNELPLAPLTINVTVDPSVAAVNDQAGTVPGVAKAFPVEAAATFDATGQAIVETAATGTVTFTSINTVSSVSVVAGTRVSTNGGVAFTTTSTVTVPKATVSGSFQLTPGRVDAPIKAVKSGVPGNVNAGSIVKVPSDLTPFQISVSNKAATSGGTHTVTPQILQSDIDGAQGNLNGQLQAQFQSALKAPSAVPSGSKLFGESARLGTTICSPDPKGLVGGSDASFQLDCNATGTAIVADMSSVADLARRRAAASVKAGYSLVVESVTTSAGGATVQGSTLIIPITIHAAQVPIVDVDELRASVKGKSLDDARAILSRYGKADISVSPGWATTMPSFDFRIDIQVVAPSSQPSSASPSKASPTSAGQGTGRPTARLTATPTSTPSPSLSATDSASPSPSASPTDTSAPSASPSPS